MMKIYTHMLKKICPPSIQSYLHPPLGSLVRDLVDLSLKRSSFQYDMMDKLLLPQKYKMKGLIK